MQHAGSSLRQAGSFTAVRGLFVASRWLLSIVLRVGFSLVVVCGFFVFFVLFSPLSSCGVWAPGHVGSVVVASGLQGTWAL